MNENEQQIYRFSEAPIWDIQRKYYEEEGLRAWNKDQVPQYITCNPIIGTAYAEMIFGVMQDRAKQGFCEEPVVIVELGAGSGRLAFHVVEALNKLIDFSGLTLPPFKYVMTDLAMNNVVAWKEHPKLQSYIEKGQIDVARFDAVNDTALHLVASKQIIHTAQLAQPIVVVANYFFDSIPQELLYIGEGNVYELDVLVEYPKQHEQLSPSQLLNQIKLEYVYRRAEAYEATDYPYESIISYYRQELEDSHILFPVAGLKCLERLSSLSQQGFILITADKGDHLIDQFKFANAPELVFHGSFSLTANYHAFVQAYTEGGGEAYFTRQHYQNINIGSILNVKNPVEYAQTRLAFKRFIERFGPDEFYSLKMWIDANVESMGLKEWLAFWRLGGYDMEFFLQSSKHLSTQLVDANDEEKEDVKDAIEQMYTSYYVMQQHYAVALEAGLILFEIDMYKESKYYLELWISEEPNETVSTVYYCLAVSCFELDLEDEGIKYLKKLVELEPNHEEAVALLDSLTQ